MKKYHAQNRLPFAAAVACILFSNALAVALQFFKGDVLDYAIAGNAQHTAKYALLLITFILGEILLYYLYKVFSARYVVSCTQSLKHDLFASIVARDYTAYKEIPQGEYISKYVSEADSISERRFAMLPMFWDILSKVFLVSIALFFLDWRIALVTLSLLTTPLYIPKLIAARLQRAQKERLAAVEENLTQITDWLAGFEMIKNYSIEGKIMKRFHQSNQACMQRLYTDKKLEAISQLLTTLISYLSYFIILAVSTLFVLNGHFTPGKFFVAIGMIDQLSYPLIALSGIIRMLVSIRPTGKEMSAFIASGVPPAPRTQLKSIGQSIRFQDVTFSYDEKRPLLQNFSFEAKKDRRYLFVGESGSGKTTALNLLLRYHDVQQGDILVDGQSINGFDETYDCMTVVRQDASLFADTLRNNLTMYSDVSDERLFSVLRQLGLSRFANKEALDQHIQENGANLSGGERKRISLARALLRNTEVLLLDEPLANLDAATAKKIEDVILAITGKTMIVVTHHFSEEKRAAFDEVITFG